LGKDAIIRVTNLSKIVVESTKGDTVRMIREIKEQIGRLEEEVNRAKAKKPSSSGLKMTAPSLAQMPMPNT
jgi:hypothetical protein